MIWVILETAVCLADSLLLCMLIYKYAHVHFSLRNVPVIIAVTLLSFLRVHFGMNRMIAPIPAVFISWCVCMYFGLKPIRSFITALLYFVFIEISEIFVMGIFTFVLRDNYADLSALPLFNLFGIVLARLVFIGIINGKQIKIQLNVPTGYQLILACSIFMIALCMECICLSVADKDMQTRLIFTFISIVMFVIIILVLLLFNMLTHYYTGYYENREIANSIKATEELYKTLAEGNEQTRRVVHDYKNHIFTALELLKQNKTEETEEYLQSIAGKLERPYKSYLHNGIADIVITKKAELAASLGVEFSVTGVMGEVNINSTDISSLISNLLDNAIEAAAKCPEGFVRLKVKMQGEYIYISTANSLNQMPKISGSEFVTTKADKENHGIGIKIIKDIVNRYNGEFDFSVENGIITVYVLLRPFSEGGNEN